MTEEQIRLLAEFQRRARAWMDAVDNWTVQQHSQDATVFDEYEKALRWFIKAQDIVP